MQITDVDRIAAKELTQQERNRIAMSDVAKAKLKAINDHDRIDGKANEELIKQFYSRPINFERVMDSMIRARNDSADLRKRALRAMHFLIRFKATTIHDIVFFGELSPDESELSLDAITRKYPAPEVIDPGMLALSTKAERIAVRRCALGTRCMRFDKKTKAGVCKTRSAYCSDGCKGRAKFIQAALGREKAPQNGCQQLVA